MSVETGSVFDDFVGLTVLTENQTETKTPSHSIQVAVVERIKSKNSGLENISYRGNHNSGQQNRRTEKMRSTNEARQIHIGKLRET